MLKKRLLCLLTVFCVSAATQIYSFSLMNRPADIFAKLDGHEPVTITAYVSDWVGTERLLKEFVLGPAKQCLFGLQDSLKYDANEEYLSQIVFTYKDAVYVLKAKTYAPDSKGNAPFDMGMGDRYIEREESSCGTYKVLALKPFCSQYGPRLRTLRYNPIPQK